MLKKFFLMFVALVFSFALTEVSHSQAVEDLLWEEIPVVYTASRRAEEAPDAPGTVIVVTADQIRERGYVNLEDVFRDLPGMEVLENYYCEQSNMVPVRGVIGNNKIVVLINGARVNPPGGEQMMFRNDFAVRNAEQIEIIYGPGSTLYGQDAISAVVNVITKKHAIEDGWQTKISGGYGMFDHKDFFVSSGRQFEDFGITGSFQIIDKDLSDYSDTFSDWYEEFHEGFIDTPERWKYGLNAHVNLFTDDTSFQLWYRESDQSSSEGGHAALKFHETAFWGDSTIMAEIQNTYQLTGNTELESTLRYRNYEVHSDSRFVWPDGDMNNPEEDLALFDDKYGYGYGVTLEERVTSEITPDLTLMGGVEASHYSVVPKFTVYGGIDKEICIMEQAAVWTIRYMEDGEEVIEEIHGAGNLKYEIYGLYAEANYNLTEELTGILGARIDMDTRHDEVPFSPRVSAIYRPVENISLKYIHNRAFVAPAPFDMYNVFDSGESINMPNPEALKFEGFDSLEPETASSHEINFTYAGGNYNLGASVYYNEQDNILTEGFDGIDSTVIKEKGEMWVTYDGGDTWYDRVLTTNVNLGESRSIGFDLYGNLRIGKHSLWGSYSYVDFEREMDDETLGLDQISEHNIRFGGTAYILDNLSITPSLVLRSTPENVYRHAIPADKEGGGNLYNEAAIILEGDEAADWPYEINAHIRYGATEDLSIYANIRNLTDNRYATKGLHSPTPQEPFKLVVGLEYLM